MFRKFLKDELEKVRVKTRLLKVGEEDKGGEKRVQEEVYERKLSYNSFCLRFIQM